MKFEIDTNKYLFEIFDDFCRENLKESLEIIKNSKNGVPIFSHDKEEEKKKVKKLIKAFERVIDWYSPPNEWKHFDE